jgi:hypothetical protein
VRALVVIGCISSLAGLDNLGLVGPLEIRLRPLGVSATHTYTLSPNQAHTLTYDSLPASFQFITAAHADGSGGTFSLSTTSTTGLSDKFKISAASNGTRISNELQLNYFVDPFPTISSPLSLATFAEDQTDQSALISFADTPNTGLTVTASGTAGQVTVTSELVSGTQYRLRVMSAANYYGATQAMVTVTDALGPKDFPLALTITNTNDPPTLALQARSNLQVDPRTATPVTLLDGVVVGAGVDPAVTSEGTSGLTLNAEVLNGTVGDLLTLTGDGSYRIDGASIFSTAAGQTTAVATWSRPQGASWRLAITLPSLAPALAIERIRQLARLVRYSHLQTHATLLNRTIHVTVSEPASNGTSAAQPCTVQVLPINAAPDVAVSTMRVPPDQSVSIPVVITDNEPLGGLSVEVLEPLPIGGTVSPMTCTAAQANAGLLHYQHRDGDVTEDAIRLRVSDGVNQPVTVSVPVLIRTSPDRLSIMSDPLLVVHEGVTVAHRIRTVPDGAVLSLADYGQPFPVRPSSGLVLSDGVLGIDWTTLPATTSWIPLRVNAQIQGPQGQTWTTSQPMLLRVKRGTAN